MGLLGAIFGKAVKKKTSEISAEVAKKVNRDLVEAAVYGCFFIASADGELEESEIKKTQKLISNEPLMKGFGAELNNLIDSAEASYTEGGPRIIRRRAKQEMEDLAHDKEAADIVMTIIATVADEGGIGDAERAALTEAAGWMNLNVKEYL
jgi:tellurite resistance protein TerB